MTIQTTTIGAYPKPEYVPIPDWFQEESTFEEDPTRALDNCNDCHDPETMDLRITRPALLEGLKKRGVDIDHATRQEMRTYVCAQCHVEYYFRGAEKRLVYPWSKGLRADEILAFYDEVGFKDWTHKETGAEDTPVAADLDRYGFHGLKPYRWYTEDPVECRITDMLPEHLIELADERGLLVVLHLGKRLGVADEQNIADLLAERIEPS